jgi:hypothetical protein
VKPVSNTRILGVGAPHAIRLLVAVGSIVGALAFPASGWAVEEDITPPEVKALSISPTAVDVTSEAQTVIVTATIIDPSTGTSGVSSGVQGGTIAYAPPGNPQGCLTFEGNLCSGFVKKAGSENEYTATVTFPKFGKSGTWTPSVRVVDRAGNFREYTSAQLEEEGFHASVSVTSTPDTTPPEVTNVTVGPPLAVTVSPPNGPQFVPVTATVKDDLSGVSEAFIEYSGPAQKHFAFASLRHTTGNEFSGMLEFRPYQEAGSWSVASIQASDGVGNRLTLTGAALAALNLPHVEVTSSPVDTEPPKLVSLKASAETPCPEPFAGACVDAQAADRVVTLKATVTDNLSGVSGIFLEYVAPGLGNIEPVFVGLQKKSGNEFEGTVTIRRFSKAGFWKPEFVDLFDSAGNGAFIRQQEISEEAWIAVSRTTVGHKVEPGEKESTGETTSEINPIQSQLTIPPGGTGGEVELSITPRTTQPPPGFFLLDQQLAIKAPTQPDTKHPLTIEFSVDSSVFTGNPQVQLPPGCISPGPGLPPPSCTLTVFKNGVPVPTCTAVPPEAISPNPCIVSPQQQMGRETKLTIYSTSASTWNIGIPTQGTKAEPTTTTTTLSGGGQAGETITVPEGTAVIDEATLSGTNAATATGKVSYKVYSDKECTKEVATAGEVEVTGPKVRASNAETLAPGTYFWQAFYSGDTANESSNNSCGSEKLTVEQGKVAKATCGNTSVGKVADGLLANRKRVNECTLPVNAAVTELSVYLQPTSTSGEEPLKGVIYASSRERPGTRLGVTEELKFSSSDAAGWYHLAFPAPVKLKAGDYWIGVITGASGKVAAERWDWVRNAEDYNANAYASGPSNPFGRFRRANEQMSLYATFTAD